ncbi:hypothetical protein [Streptomyces sp. NPDC088350]|uniref:hypothetical protein n=1 Tax=Streptomyces sp. NPDC088350 TaxID=3365854 RepID=UPI0037FD022B
MTALRIHRVHVSVPRATDTTAAALLALTEGFLLFLHWFDYAMSGFSGDPGEVARASLTLAHWGFGLALGAALCAATASLLGLRRTAWVQAAAAVVLLLVAGAHL